MSLKVRMVLAGGSGDRAPLALAFLLDTLTRWDVELMRKTPVPDLYRSGVRYQREDYDGPHPEDWRDCLEVLKRGGGDCEDLAAYRAAELRVRGEPAKCEFVVRRIPRGRLFHIVVRRGDGRLEDPSRALGMMTE